MLISGIITYLVKLNSITHQCRRDRYVNGINTCRWILMHSTVHDV